MKIILASAALLLGITAPGQTNMQFQGCAVGALVAVNSQKPLIILKRAVLSEIGASNIVVTANGERYVLSQTSTVLTGIGIPKAEPGRESGSSQSVTQRNGAPGAAPAMDIKGLMSVVQQSVLGKYQSDPGHSNAVAIYQNTMGDYMSGKISLADITDRAEKVLAEVDKYKPERERDPQFEEQIGVLKDFVRRAKAGETAEQHIPVD